MALSLVEQLGVAGFLLFPLFFLGRWAVNKILKENSERQNTLMSLVKDLHSVMLFEGKPFRVEEVLRRQANMYRTIEDVLNEDRDMFRRIVSSQEIISSDEHWKHCEIERCPHMHNILSTINDIKVCASDFVQSGHHARQQTDDRITGIDQNIKAFANGILALVKQSQEEISGYAGEGKNIHNETLHRLQAIEEQVKLFASEFINTHRVMLERVYRDRDGRIQ